MDVVVDLAVSFELGSNVATLTPRTDSGRAWLRSAPFEPWQRLGDSVGVDVRVVDQLVADAEADGLVVCVSRKRWTRFRVHRFVPPPWPRSRARRRRRPVRR